MLKKILPQKLLRKSFSCDQCIQNFKHNWSLILHDRIHAGIKPFTCQFCDKSFSYAGDATIIHEIIHTGERPFLCQICDSKFISSTEFNRHKLVHIRNHALVTFAVQSSKVRPTSKGMKTSLKKRSL